MSTCQIVIFTNVKIETTTHQVVLFAVYAYFTLALIAEQQHCNEPFIPVPIFLILKFVFFIGWLEVALSIDDPWDGRDRMDFQVTIVIINSISITHRMDFQGGPRFKFI